jgi:hypothetical protein
MRGIFVFVKILCTLRISTSEAEARMQMERAGALQFFDWHEKSLVLQKVK